MTLYIDIQNKKLVQSLTSDRSIQTPAFMQGDNEPLILNLLEAGVENLYQEKTIDPTTDFLRVAIARFSGYPKSLTYASGYTVNPNGGAQILLPLNTLNIENALQDNEFRYRRLSNFFKTQYHRFLRLLASFQSVNLMGKKAYLKPLTVLQIQIWRTILTKTNPRLLQVLFGGRIVRIFPLKSQKLRMQMLKKNIKIFHF